MKRPHLRFSIRTLLVAVLLVAVGVGGYVWYQQWSLPNLRARPPFVRINKTDSKLFQIWVYSDRRESEPQEYYGDLRPFGNLNSATSEGGVRPRYRYSFQEWALDPGIDSAADAGFIPAELQARYTAILEAINKSHDIETMPCGKDIYIELPRDFPRLKHVPNGSGDRLVLIKYRERVFKMPVEVEYPLLRPSDLAPMYGALYLLEKKFSRIEAADQPQAAAMQSGSLAIPLRFESKGKAVVYGREVCVESIKDSPGGPVAHVCISGDSKQAATHCDLRGGDILAIAGHRHRVRRVVPREQVRGKDGKQYQAIGWVELDPTPLKD